jgi:hypothetical protein
MLAEKRLKSLVTIMSPDTPMFGRVTINGNRISLGRAGTTTLLIRLAQQLRKVRPSDDSVIQVELSRNNLPDSTTFDKLAREEQQFAERVITDRDALSPWPGVTVGTVALAMESPEYIAYNEICDPQKRIGMSDLKIQRIIDAYATLFPDCISHFPKWIES